MSKSHCPATPEVSSRFGSPTRLKSRSHLVLFETIEPRTDRISRQTEHHNAIGYLTRPSQFSDNPDRCHADRRRTTTPTPMMNASTAASPTPPKTAMRHSSHLDLYQQHQLYQRSQSPEKPILTLADRNQSSAVAEALGGSGGGATSVESGGARSISRPQSSLGVNCRSRLQRPANNQTSPAFSASVGDVYHQHQQHHQQLQQQQPQQHEYRRLSQSFYEPPQTVNNARSTTPAAFSSVGFQHFDRTHHHYQLQQQQQQLQHQSTTGFCSPTLPIDTEDNEEFYYIDQFSDTTHRARHLSRPRSALYNYSTSNTMADETSSQHRILIKNARCVNDDAIFDADIYIEEGIIKEVGQHLIVPGGVRTIDAQGHYVIPGGIDTHTHMNMPFMGAQAVDDFYSGTRAALAGGTTMIMDFVIPEKGGSLIEAYHKWRSWGDEQACCDYSLRVAIPNFQPGKTDVEMEQLVKEHGINGFKCFMAYKDMLMLSDEEMLQVFQKCAEIGAVAMVHAENGDIIDYNVKKLKALGITGPEGHIQSRPEEVEAEATHRACTLANQVNCPLYVVHVMSKSAADVIVQARNRGVVVFGEPIAAGLGSDGTHYFHRCWRHAAAHILSPPLRPDQSTPEHLINLLASGQLQTTGSDHCTFNSKQKSLGSQDFTKIPNGVNGVEERLMILWERGVRNGKLDPKQFVAVTSTNAAKMFNIYPRKGRIARGSDADLVIWGSRPYTIKAETHHSKVDFNIFEGMQVANGPLVVISNGKVVMDEDGMHIVQSSGRFVPCSPNSSYAFATIRNREKVMPIKVDRSEQHEEDDEKPVKAVVLNQGIPAPVILDNARPGSGCVSSPNGFHRGATRSGVRNQQDSSFNLAGQQFNDERQSKTAVRVHNPPGGRSSGIF